MRILHLSDTHGCHRRLRELPEADVVVHSGDFCMVGTEEEAIDFMNWFCDLPYKHKILLPEIMMTVYTVRISKDLTIILITYVIPELR